MTTLVAVLGLILGAAVPATAAATPAVPSTTSAVAPVSATGPTASTGLINGPAKMSLDGWSAGNIISDAVFTDKATLNEAQIQSFLNAKASKCEAGYTCLKDFRLSTPSRGADKYCSGYTGEANESAARILYKVAQSCGINPQVLVVMLQKEQGLVTHPYPTAGRYAIAMGFNCPDTAPCDAGSAGFFTQVYGAARQMQVYMEGRYFTWYAPGKTWNILYNTSTSCGSAPVYVANKATSALYYYTPYQPNPAALAAGYGEAPCGAYGNRNFYNYFTDWFGPTRYQAFTPGGVTVSGTFTPGQVVQVSGKFSPTPTTTLYQWYRNGEVIPGATQPTYKVVVDDIGTKIDVIVFARSSGYQESQQRSPAYYVSPVKVDRLYGDTREATAIAVSRAAWPSGTKTVFLATSLEFADALSAAAAAGKAGASLLLTPATALPATVAAEMKRLAPTRIVLMGGEGVLSRGLAQSVAATVPGATIERVAGANRFATSQAMVEWGGDNTNLFIASGWGFADALSAASVGSNNGTPVLLVDGTASSLDAGSVATIRKIGANSVTIIGGHGSVSDRIAENLEALGVGVSRLSGNDRYLTNAAVNKVYFPGTALRVLAAAGTDFPDALSASALAGRWKVPLLLSEPSCLPMPGSDFIRTRITDSVVLVGGPGVLTADGVGQLRACG